MENKTLICLVRVESNPSGSLHQTLDGWLRRERCPCHCVMEAAEISAGISLQLLC